MKSEDDKKTDLSKGGSYREVADKIKDIQQSFETGKPVTVGAGVVDPNTGQVSKGRRIDPSVAKELGFETWRDWYLTDRHAEQMRLQREALLQRNENEGSDNGTVTLPPVVERPDSSRPEQD